MVKFLICGRDIFSPKHTCRIHSSAVALNRPERISSHQVMMFLDSERDYFKKSPQVGCEA